MRQKRFGLNIIIILDIGKIGSVGPVQPQIKLVSPK
jgi:hypothetical protein